MQHTPTTVALPLQQRGQDAAVGVHPPGNIGHRNSALGRGLLSAGHRDHARLGLDKQIVRLLVTVRPVRAVPADMTHDQVGVVRAQPLIVEAQPLHCARRQVLNKNVCLLQQLAQNLLATGRLQIQRNRLLRAVRPREVAAQTPRRRVIMPREITVARPLHLDHPRAQVGQMPRSQRRRNRLLQRNNGNM